MPLEMWYDDDICVSLFILLGASEAVRVKPRFPPRPFKIRAGVRYYYFVNILNLLKNPHFWNGLGMLSEIWTTLRRHLLKNIY